jgi:hypothetical protein
MAALHVIGIRSMPPPPLVPQSLFNTPVESKNVRVESIHKNGGPHSILPWAGDYIEESRELMSEDLWPHGSEGNRKPLDIFTRRTSQQRLEVEEFFAKETSDTFRV